MPCDASRKLVKCCTTHVTNTATDARTGVLHTIAMPIYTKKDYAADHDPRRMHILPPSGITGWVDASSIELHKAYAYLESVHRAPCVLGRTPLVVQRMPVLGIANDINYVVRAFALSQRKISEGQLVLLPPDRAPGVKGKENNRQSLAAGRTLDNPWHWFDGLPGVHMADLFTPSACQERLQQPDEIDRLRALHERSRHKNGTLAEAARNLGLGKAFDTNGAVKAIARGFVLSDIPADFRHHGMLWWFQALSTYLVRVRGPLAARLRDHAAMMSLASRQAAGILAASTAAQRDWLAASQDALRKAVKGGAADVGWVPPVSFDAALHVRMGDACGPQAKSHQAAVRKCVLSLAAGLAPLLAHGVVPRGGHLFLATDSARIVAEAEAAASSLPFEVHFMRIDRAKYDSSAWIELASAKQRNQGSVVDETLLDVLLLSRARYVAGSMYGNVPRLALQLRATTPGDPRRLAYITTDGRDWCTTPTCSKNNTATGRYW